MRDFAAALSAIDRAGLTLNGAWARTGTLTGLERELLRDRLENLASLLHAAARDCKREDGSSAYHSLQNCYAGADWVGATISGDEVLITSKAAVDCFGIHVGPALDSIRSDVAAALELLGFDKTQSPPPDRH